MSKHSHPGSMHGSPHETAKFHGGKVKGAGELTFGMGPGRAAMRTKGGEMNGIEKSGKSPKKIPMSPKRDESDAN